MNTAVTEANEPITIDVEKVMAAKNSTLAKYTPKFVIDFIKRLIHQEEINALLEKSRGLSGLEFAEKAINELNVKCNVTYLNQSALDPDGRYIFVSNHPLGGLDGLILISELGKRLGNIKFVVNDFLMHIKPLEPIFVPVNKVGSMGKEYLYKFEEAYNSSCHILYFPAGMCSRLINGEITDTQWKTSFIKQAIRYNRKIVPVYFSGNNSNFFYRLAKVRKFLKIKFNIEMCFLPDEMFKQKNATFDLVIGTPISVPRLCNAVEIGELCCRIREKAYSLKNLVKNS